MIGTIIGDTVGSRFERRNHRTKEKDFDLITDECSFTDDSVLTIATADCILHDPTLNYTLYVILPEVGSEISSLWIWWHVY